MMVKVGQDDSIVMWQLSHLEKSCGDQSARRTDHDPIDRFGHFAPLTANLRNEQVIGFLDTILNQITTKIAFTQGAS
jgi:hypothetical protein